jgi:hypothetical protein
LQNAVVTSVVIATGKAMLKGAQWKMFCCAPFVLFLRRVWVDGAQGRWGMLPITLFFLFSQLS